MTFTADQECLITEEPVFRESTHIEDFKKNEHDALFKTIQKLLPSNEKTPHLTMEQLLENPKIPIFSIGIHNRYAYNYVENTYEELAEGKYKRYLEYLFNGIPPSISNLITKLRLGVPHPYYLTVEKSNCDIYGVSFSNYCIFLHLNATEASQDKDLSNKAITFKKDRSCFFFKYETPVLQ